jgi:hypothetical protein
MSRHTLTAALLVAGVCIPAAGATAAGPSSEDLPASYKYTCGHLGVPCVDDLVEERPVSVRVSPARAVTGRVTRFRVSVTRHGRRGRPIASATVRFAGRTVKTDGAGRATIVARFRTAGRHLATVRQSDAAAGRTWVQVLG